MPPKPKFADNERVLCFHGNLLYEAKCVKSEVKEKTSRYFIHYNGWNKNWDEWVPESRVLKFNDAGLQKQKELQKANAGSKGPKRGAGQVGRPKRTDKEKDPGTPVSEKPTERAATPTTEGRRGRADKRKGAEKAGSERGSRASTPIDGTPKDRTEKRTPSASESKADKDKSKDRGKKDKDVKEKVKETVDQPAKVGDKRKNSTSTVAPAETPEPKKKRSRIEATVEPEEVYAAKIEIRIKIPDELKPWLMDDWDLITRQKMLVSLPCKQTVDSILDEYVKWKTTKGNHPQKDAIIEMADGIRDYFNVMLGTQLLYKFERIQYREILAEHHDTPMCKIYGVMHLVRLFTKLGNMLAYTPLDEKSVSLLLLHLHELLRYIAKSGTLSFQLSDYMVAPPEYHRKSLC